MKKYSYLFSFLGVFLVSALMFTSCSSDDDQLDDPSDSSAIVGEWANIEYGSNGRWMYMELINFKRNGSFTTVIYYVEGKNLNGGNAKINSIEKERTSGTYSTSNGEITMTANNKTWVVNYSIKSDRLTIYDDDGNYIYEVVTEELEQQFDQMEEWYRSLNNMPPDDNNDDPIEEEGEQDNDLIDDWIALEISSNGRYIEMEQITFKSNGTYTIVDYAIHGKNLDTGGSVEQVDKQENSGKYRILPGGALTLTSSEGESITILYNATETSLILSRGEATITYQRVTGDMRNFINMIEFIYQSQKK